MGIGEVEMVVRDGSCQERRWSGRHRVEEREKAN